MSSFTLLQGDCRERLRELADASVDSIVCDPPYGLSREPDMAEVLRHWLAGDDYEHTGRGFMGKSWDSFVPGPAVWREALRVLKPGGHLLAFSGTRTYDMAVLAIRLAGFEIRDQLAWVYGSGMPKSRNLGDGWGTQLKPSWEPIVMARKPFDGSASECRAAHGTGGLNIDACRIEVLDDTYARNCSGDRGHGGTREAGAAGATDIRTGGGRAAAGRWPANILHDGSDEVLQHFPSKAGASAPVRGTEPSAASVGLVTGERARVAGVFHSDSGGAARFFYCGKASTAEREAGLDGLPDRVLARSNLAQTQEGAGDTVAKAGGAFNVARVRKNHHPTVKPIALIRWLQRLVTPAGGTTLDLYAGSGTSGVAAILEGFHPILIELDRDDAGEPLGYEPIIRARCAWALEEREREREAAEEAARIAAFRAAQLDFFAAAAS